MLSRVQILYEYQEPDVDTRINSTAVTDDLTPEQARKLVDEIFNK